MTSEQVPVLSVLIVEDRDDVADSTAELLAYYGYKVRVARCGADALAAAAADPPDVILMDIGLPDMDGWAVSRELREHTRGRQPVVVAVTGRATAEDQQASIDAGIYAHFVKPIDPRYLTGFLAHIANALRQPPGEPVNRISDSLY